jgi:hypothetical protein
VWRHIAQSLQGPSHVANGTECQDNHSILFLGNESATTLVACIADGAGSAKFSEVGSAIACEAIAASAAAYFSVKGHFGDLTRDDILAWFGGARTRIQAAADERSCEIRDLATTFAGVIAGPESTTFFQIGDGAIVLRVNQVYGVVFWPQSGEYANTTNFLTGDTFEDSLAFFVMRNPCSNIALLTDGLERLALRFDAQTPHVPFFEPLFLALRTADDVAGLSDGLRQFLGSDAVQNRSDDDKTLILATRDDSNDAR